MAKICKSHHNQFTTISFKTWCFSFLLLPAEYYPYLLRSLTHSHPFPPIPTHSHPFPPIPTHSHPFPPIPTHSHPSTSHPTHQPPAQHTTTHPPNAGAPPLSTAEPLVPADVLRAWVIEDTEVFEQVKALQVGTVVEPTKVTEAKSQHHQHKHPTHRPSRETPLPLQKHCSGCEKDRSHCEKNTFPAKFAQRRQSRTNIVYRAKSTICCEGNLFSHC